MRPERHSQRRALPSLSVPGGIRDDAEHQPCRVPHQLPSLHPLHAFRAQSLQPSHLGFQIVGVDVQVHTRGPRTKPLREQPELLAVQCRAVVLGEGELRERLAERRLPERQFPVVVTGGNVDDNLDQPAEVSHRIKIRAGRPGPEP